ncbi:sugar lactone lactonase YvrE [Marmoricola sp. OAE513]|uniref:Ig-like domain-containing protein n=1 Tax=Marmoricola sp. OAE513 TaxID=2817894 RepID=UPI001AE7A541
MHLRIRRTHRSTRNPVGRNPVGRSAAAAVAGSLLAAGTLAAPTAHAAAPIVTTGDILVSTYGHVFDGGSGIDRIDRTTAERSRAASFGIGYAADEVIAEPDGDLIVGNDAGRIVRVDHLTGKQTVLLDHIDDIYGRAFDEIVLRSDGNLAMVVMFEHESKLATFNPSTGKLTYLSSSTILRGTAGLAVDWHGDYVVSADESVWRINQTNGNVSKIADLGGRVGGLVIDRKGRILVHVRAAGTQGTRIAAIAPGTNAVSTAAQAGNLTTQNFGMALEADGRLVALEVEGAQGTAALVRVDPDSGGQAVLTTVGSDEARDVTIVGSSQIGGFTRPVAGDDTFSTDAGLGQVTGKLLANDHDPLGQKIHYVTASNPSHGFISANDDGSFFYFPDAGFTGQDSWTYRAVSADGRPSATAVVRVNVAPAVSPTAHHDEWTTTVNWALQVPAPGVLANDTDPQGGPLTAKLVTKPAQGEFALQPDGGFVYVPPVGYTGQQSFSYEVVDAEGHHSLPGSVRLTVEEPKPTDPGTPDPGTPDPGTPDPGTPDPGTPGNPQPSPNTAPVVKIGNGPGLAAGADGRSGTFPLTVTDKETPTSVKLAVTSSNTRLVPVSGLKLATATNGARLLTITAAPRGKGSALVKVTASDGGKKTVLTIVVRTGNARANKLIGTAGPDLLIGRGGKDRLSGGAGRDVLTGGSGKDRLRGGAGSDVFRGGTGKDRVLDFAAKLGDLRVQI